MKIKDKYKNDIAIIMSKKHANGGDLWASEDNNIGKGSPFSTRDVALILTELGVGFPFIVQFKSRYFF